MPYPSPLSDFANGFLLLILDYNTCAQYDSFINLPRDTVFIAMLSGNMQTRAVFNTFVAPQGIEPQFLE